MTRKRRLTGIAIFLSFLMPGLGHMYLGRLFRGICFFLFGSLLTLTVGYLIVLSFYLLLLMLVVIVLFVLYCLQDTWRLGRQSRAIRLKRYNHWFGYLLFLVITVSLSYFEEGLLRDSIKVFRIPSRSMKAAIQVGDYVMVNKRQYAGSLPKRGDIIVFTRPDNPATSRNESLTYHIKRIVGVPGERIQVQGAKVLINDLPADEPYAKWIRGGMKNSANELIPENSFFVLGDNRDRSKDSRYFAETFVSLDRIEGKAMYVCFAWPNWRRVGTELE